MIIFIFEELGETRGVSRVVVLLLVRLELWKKMEELWIVVERLDALDRTPVDELKLELKERSELVVFAEDRLERL